MKGINSGSKEETYFYSREREALAALSHPQHHVPLTLNGPTEEFAFIGAIGEAADRFSVALHEVVARTLVAPTLED